MTRGIRSRRVLFFCATGKVAKETRTARIFGRLSPLRGVASSLFAPPLGWSGPRRSRKLGGTMMILNELLAFAMDKAPWQQDLIRRIYTQGDLTPADEE